MYRFYFISLFITAGLQLFSQSGPAGVGSSVNNVLWLKADAGTSATTDASAISSWNDQSGNAIHVSQGTAVQQPLYKASLMNGMPAIEFDNISTAGQNDYLSAADNSLLDNTAGYTTFSVVRMKTFNGTGQSILSKRTAVDADEAFMFFFYTGNNMYLDVDGLNNRFNSAHAYSVNTNYLLGFTYDGTAASASRSKILEGDSVRKVSTELSTFVSDKPSPLTIGATHITDPRSFGGYISEIIMYRSVLNDAQHTIVNNYLSAKYDIALLKNDKYAGDDMIKGDFDKDVAGIGQDANGSNTTFDAATTKGLKLTATAGFDNGDYIFTGHRYPYNWQNITDVSGMTGINNARWERNWYIDITNTSTVPAVDLEFDFSDAGIAGLPSGNDSGYVLLYRPVNYGNWTELATSGTIVGDRVIFTGYQLMNDGYYTLGGKNYMTGTLSVSLLNFEATQEKSGAHLQWETATETDNKFYTLERSVDAIEYEEIARLDSKATDGSSTVKLSYSFTDPMPLEGLSYYRLRQTDFNGQGKVFAPVSFLFEKEKQLSFTLYPNPGKGDFMLDYAGVGSNEDIQVGVFDLQGRNVYNHTFSSGAAGQGTLQVLPYNKPEAGLYFVQINCAGTMYTLKEIIE
ncbi:MAG: hypothetical protein K0S33_1506 [Bacteroidetes bacterium]|jgi:hypothetical protein|nr:hypothetical protein [Bacteroidota bacterium]